MISNSGTSTLGLYDLKRQIDAFGGVDYFRPNLAGGYLKNARVMLANGDIVKSTVNGNVNNPNLNMTGWVLTNYASQILDSFGMSQEDINRFNLTVDNFGAKGNGVDDDSLAFQAYIDSALTSNIVYLGHRRAKYCIKNEVDFKNKGLVGHGYSTHSQGYLSSIYVPNDFVGTTVFKNIEGTLRNINAVQQTKNTLVNFAHVIPYLLVADNLNIDGFNYQIYGSRETCVTTFSNIKSINNTKSAIYFPDTGIAHTTTWFKNIHFQWGNYSFVCDGDCFGFSFKNIVVEQMLGGIKSKLFTNCSFDDFWCEGRQGLTVAKDVIEQITGQQMDGNTYGVFRFIDAWTAPQQENLAQTSTAGGIAQVRNELFASGTTGNRTVFGYNGIRTAFSNWYTGSVANPRALLITSQGQAAESGYITPIEIRAPYKGLALTNLSKTDYRPFETMHTVGKKLGEDTYQLAASRLSVNEWSADFYNETNGVFGKFQSKMLYTWDTLHGVKTGGGWVLSKITVGWYRLSRDVGNNKYLINGHAEVSGIFSSSFLSHRLTAIESYSGSWGVDRVSAGFDIYFANQSGVAVDPERFTVGITLVS